MDNPSSGPVITASPVPNVTRRHREALVAALSPKNEKWFRDERLWSFLVASLIQERPDPLVRLICGQPRSLYGLTVWCEAEPMSARPSEGNTVVDIAFGHIVGRVVSGNAHAAIAPGNASVDSWVCFVETKFLSDLGYRVTNDPARNQMARNVENLLCFQAADAAPPHLHFALLTPRLFRDRPTSRFYGYKFRDYRENRQSIIDDIDSCPMDRRTTTHYRWPDVASRLSALAAPQWITFEDVFAVVGAPGVDNVLSAERGPFGEWFRSELRARLTPEHRSQDRPTVE